MGATTALTLHTKSHVITTMTEQMNRVDRIREAHPELSDEQARGMLIRQYMQLSVEGDELQHELDVFTEAVELADITTIGLMLEVAGL